MFFDAKTTGFSADGKSQIFRGEVVAIGSGVLITADQIVFDQNSRTMDASGHVVVLTARQIFTGERIQFKVDSGDFRIDSALMISNDPEQVDRIARRILGFTAKEVEFEQQRQERLNELIRRKETLRREFRGAVGGSNDASNEIIDRYALLLEQEELTKTSENPALAKMAPERRKVFESRRKYWEEGRKSVSLQTPATYFRIQGSVLERTNQNDYAAKDAVWSPCKCKDDEAPAWGFRASTVEAQVGGYVDLHHPVLEIKGVPLIYLPYLKLPVKSERQSGFLMPVVTHDSISGNTISQPLYLALSESQDATVTTEIIENRGTKLALEWRWKSAQHSGWNLNIEGIRDRLWLSERETRLEILEQQPNGPSAEFQVPPNTWRSAKRWNGLSILSPRVSFVSNGQVLSDHRYLDDLSIVNSAQDLFNPGQKAGYFTPSRMQLNYAGRDVFLSGGSAVADNVTSSRPYTGLQEPLRLNVLTRHFRLTPRGWRRLPVYGSFLAEAQQFREFYSPLVGSEMERADGALGDGNWGRGKVDLTTPLLPDAIISVEGFADAEVRRIQSDTLEKRIANIRSWRTGVTFRLPMEGESETPRWLFREKISADDQAVNGVLHRMEWNATLSSRPVVVRDSNYGTGSWSYNDRPYLSTYKVSDTEVLPPGDIVAPGDMMARHRRVELGTSHRWIYFTRQWRLIEPDRKPPTQERARARTYLERARQELLFSLDRNVAGVEDLFASQNGKTEWFINRYNYQTTGESEFFTLNAGIGYDFLKEENRQKLKRANDPRASNEEYRPWDDATADASIYALGAAFVAKTRYDIYTKLLESSTFTLTSPTFFSSNATYTLNVEVPSAIRRTTSRTVNVNTSIIPHLQLGAVIGHRLHTEENAETGVETTREEDYNQYSFTYQSPSDCWQLVFARTKDYGKMEREAEYVMAVNVLFLGQARPLPDFGKSKVLRTVYER
jgi:hypothetical protein